MPLFDTYNTLFENIKSWKYYSAMHLENPFLNENAFGHFISDYFSAGGKEIILQNVNLSNERKIHTISTFFLGIYLNKIFQIDNIKPDFRYLWFLSCLYHDYGYYYEDNPDSISNATFDDVFNRLDIQYNIFDDNNQNLNIDDSIVKKYYDFCLREKGFVNHGIIGGILLYDRLKRNFEQIYNEAKSQNNISKTRFKYKNLYWSENHDNYYRKAAYAIIKHNIWYAYDKTTINEYRINHLDSLVIDDAKRISFQSDSFLFLLLLADTIEPTKFFNNIDFMSVLNSINIIFDIENKKIWISVDKENKEINHIVWFKRIKEMSKWLNVKVILYTKSRYLTIKILKN